MAYLALARKWRPKSFAEVVGQSHVVQALSNSLDSGRVHHAFLFTGTRGVGKTTLARIFAKSLNCEQGVSAEPCQQCSTCQSIDEGRFVDLIEVDAASRTKVEDTRELLENVQYAPTSGKYKVYLIDETHMLSGHSFNALLKTLEEPPEHVKFLFATTDPQKMPVTVLSRCLQFNLRAMRPEQVENQLHKILLAEEIEFDQQALKLIALAADGSMRDGLSLLDQAIAQGLDGVRQAVVESMLGTIKSQHTQAIVGALLASDADNVLKIVAEMADHAVDFASALDEVMMQLYRISITQLAPAASTGNDANNKWYQDMAASTSADHVQLLYQIGLHGKRDIDLAPSLRVGFEMAMLRMLAFEVSEESIAPARPTEAESSQAVVSEIGANQTKSTRPVSAASEPIISQPVLSNQVNTNAPPSDAVPAAEKTPDVSNANQAEPATATAIAVTLAGNNEWGEVIEQSQLQGLPKELAMNCACERLGEDRIDISLAPNLKHLFKPDRLDQVQQAMNDLFKREMKIELEFEESDKETPTECLQRLGHEQFEQTKQNLQNDPGVKALMSEFGATLNEESIKPN